MLSVQLQVYPCLQPAGTFQYVILYASQIVATGNAATQLAAVKAGTAALNAYAQAL